MGAWQRGPGSMSPAAGARHDQNLNLGSEGCELSILSLHYPAIRSDQDEMSKRCSNLVWKQESLIPNFLCKTFPNDDASWEFLS